MSNATRSRASNGALCHVASCAAVFATKRRLTALLLVPRLSISGPSGSKLRAYWRVATPTSIFDETSDKKIDRITNVSLRPVMDIVTEEGLNPYNLLERTFEMARRQALGVDDVLETILQSLKD